MLVVTTYNSSIMLIFKLVGIQSVTLYVYPTIIQNEGVRHWMVHLKLGFLITTI